MKANNGYRKPTGAELRAMREERLAAAPTSEAARRESSFLRNIAGAGDDLEWILLNQAWTQLDFDRVGDWWEQRVLPVLDKLDLRPSVGLAERVIAAIQADEQALPKTQRRTQREIASIAKTSQARVSRLLADSSESRSDLEEKPAAPAEPDPSHLVDAVNQMLTDAADRAGVDEDEETEHETLPAEAWRCEECNHGLAEPFVRKGERRCINCDANRTHVAAEPGGPCLTCSGSGYGPSPVAGSGHGQENGWTGPNGDCGASCTCGVMFDGFATIAEALELLDGHIANPEERDEEEAVEPPVDTPAAGTALPGEDTSFPLVSEPQQPGQYSPVGREGGRPETNFPAGPDQQDPRSDAPEVPAVATTVLPGIDHHRAGVSGGGHAPDEVTSVELEELEDGGVLPPESPSSSDPAVLLRLFAEFLHSLDRTDIDVIAPLLLTEEMQQLHEAADRVATFVGLLETWRTP